jgi:hypothetical protein
MVGRDDVSGGPHRKDILWGLEYPYGQHRRRRRGAGAGGGGTLIISPSVLTVPDNAPLATVVGTVSVVGGSGTYTFSIVDPSGQFTMVGNQILVNSPLTLGNYTVRINAANGAGDIPTTLTTISVISGGYVPTYYLYGF